MIAVTVPQFLLLPMIVSMLLCVVGCGGSDRTSEFAMAEWYELSSAELRQAHEVTCEYITAFAANDWQKIQRLHSEMLATQKGVALWIEKGYRDKGIWRSYIGEAELRALCTDKWAVVTGLTEQQWHILLVLCIYRPEAVDQIEEGVWPEKAVIFAVGNQEPLFIPTVREDGGQWRILSQLGTLNEVLDPLLKDGDIALTALPE